MNSKKPATSHWGTISVFAVLLGCIVFLAIRSGNAESDLADVQAQLTETKQAQQKLIATCSKASKRPRQQRLIISKPFRPVNFTVDFFNMTYRGRSSNIIDRHVFFYGAFEKYLLYVMRDVMQSMRPKDGVFVDVGANKGHHALFMSQYAKIVHAIEPFQPVLVEFRQMIKDNKIANIKIHPVALGNKSEMLTFYEPPKGNMGVGTFLGKYTKGRKATKLPIVSGDDLFQKAAIKRIDLIKIDIEGYEKPALQGLRKTLESSRPLVLVELTCDPKIKKLFSSKRELVSVFPKGYEFRVVSGKNRAGMVDGVYKLLPFDPDFSKPGQYDVLAFPPEKAKHVKL